MPIWGLLTFFFFKFAFQNPDLEPETTNGCFLYQDPTTEEKMVAPMRPEVDGDGYVDFGRAFIVWFKMGFYIYAITAGLWLCSILGCCVGSGGLVSLGCCPTTCCLMPLGLVWTILGALWRWGDDGTLCAAHGKNVKAELGYMPASGKFMNIFSIINIVFWSIVCMPCICFCLAAAGG